MREEIQLREGVFAVGPDDYARVVEVWEASIRATHTFATEADIEVIRPLVRDGLPDVPHLLCVREPAGQVVGFIGVQDGKVEMLFVHPAWRGQGIGRRLLSYAVTTLGADRLDLTLRTGYSPTGSRFSAPTIAGTPRRRCPRQWMLRAAFSSRSRMSPQLVQTGVRTESD